MGLGVEIGETEKKKKTFIKPLKFTYVHPNQTLKERTEAVVRYKGVVVFVYTPILRKG